MLDLLVESEGEPDLLQISGGEPTLHPQILDILRAARRRPIRHIMLNTNGIRIASDADFVAALAEMKRAFEVYLQFDALSKEALQTIRGADLRRVIVGHCDTVNSVEWTSPAHVMEYLLPANRGARIT